MGLGDARPVPKMARMFDLGITAVHARRAPPKETQRAVHFRCGCATWWRGWMATDAPWWRDESHLCMAHAVVLNPLADPAEEHVSSLIP